MILIYYLYIYTSHHRVISLRPNYPAGLESTVLDAFCLLSKSSSRPVNILHNPALLSDFSLWVSELHGLGGWGHPDGRPPVSKHLRRSGRPSPTTGTFVLSAAPSACDPFTDNNKRRRFPPPEQLSLRGSHTTLTFLKHDLSLSHAASVEGITNQINHRRSL